MHDAYGVGQTGSHRRSLRFAENSTSYRRANISSGNPGLSRVVKKCSSASEELALATRYNERIVSSNS